MIAYRGRGGLIALIAFGCLVLSEFLTNRYFHDDRFYATHGWPKLVGFLAAAAIVWRLSLNLGEDAVPSIREEERQAFFRSSDDFFFVGARYWPAILCVLGVVFYFYRV